MPENNGMNMGLGERGQGSGIGMIQQMLEARRKPEQYSTFNRGDDWFNVSNYQDGNYMDPGSLYDMVMGKDFKPGETYKSAGDAYSAYQQLNPYFGKGSRMGGPQAQNQWDTGWNPIFLPTVQNLAPTQPGPGQPTGPGGTWDTPVTPPPTNVPTPSAAAGPAPAQQAASPSAFAWGANSMYGNALTDRDPYGEFGRRRGL